MTAEIIFFPVGNGDMTLIKTSSGKNILIDCNIRDPKDNPDVLKMLKDELNTDGLGRHYVDLFVWSHPDEDHCRGVSSNFFLGKPDEYPQGSKKIFIKEIWSSPVVYRRANKKEGFVFCKDAKDLKGEVKRRVIHFKENWFASDGNRVRVLGEDENNKTDNIPQITLKLDEKTSVIGGISQSDFTAYLYGPASPSKISGEEEKFSKNNSSVIINYAISSGQTTAKFLTGGDAEVACWENLHDRLSDSLSNLDYHILQTPHHCSWHSLSEESWSKIKEKKLDPGENVSQKALETLNNAQSEAIIVSSSNAIEDDSNDPPCYGAKDQYQNIVSEVDGKFVCVADSLDDDGNNVPYRIEISDTGGIKTKSGSSFAGSLGGGAHVNRSGTDSYA
ncbi:hypothetical protein [Thalassolituus sp. UBA2009]|uniref:hypothetical protein n=1 Tax=Thalassolituus sp. UBA2009 TaxID=1947658 RepID=UPI000C51B5D5|nr:hypothetical protein [Thalassolituus sp. UBA2009]MAY15945.1 hypothetical protein [Oceanospirillaceae bacterium]|tara:strand:- start:3424 stop:4593 length:1170 start_codon:yes stop_codon:yes gene_type:complete